MTYATVYCCMASSLHYAAESIKYKIKDAKISQKPT